MNKMQHTKSDILSTLAYFDIFNHPLTKKEIWLFLPAYREQAELDDSLQALVNDAVIFKFGEMYSLSNDPEIIEVRKENNRNAATLIITAKKVASFLVKFPFVRGLGVSGSLSKNVANKSSDIDFFIVTAPNRLWIARSFMHCFKKFTFLFNKQHLFCMNYFIDEAEMEIEEKNIYTATEIVTLLPLQGAMTLERFYNANTWSKHYLPNQFMRVSIAENAKHFFPKYLIEKVFDNGFGNWLDDLLMNVTSKRWQRKTIVNKKNSRGITMSMIAGKHVAKPDPVFFQSGLLDKHCKKVEQLIKQVEPGYALVK